MKQQMFSFTVLISAVLCLWTIMAFGQSFPGEPTGHLGKGTISDMAYFPDGKLLAVAGGAGVWLYDAKDLTEVGLLEGASQHIAISPNGEILASAHEGKIRLWDLQSKKQVGWLQDGDDPFLARDVLAISPDGKTLASPHRIWDLESQELVDSIEASDFDDGRPILLSVVFNSNGKNIVLGSDEGIWLWNIQTQKQVGRFQDSGLVFSLAISPDGKTLASAGIGDILLWDMQTLEQVGQLKAEEDSPFLFVYSLAFSPDGKTLASASQARFALDQVVRLWDVTLKQQIWQSQVYEAPVPKVAFSPDGRTLSSLSSLDQTVRFWDVESQQQVRVLRHTGGMSSLAFTPDGKTLISGSNDGTIRPWNIASRQQVGRLEHNGLSSFVIRPDGQTLASMGGGKAILWELDSQRQVAVLDAGLGTLSSDGQILASATNNTIQLWDFPAQEQIGQIKLKEWVSFIALSPEGKTLASGGETAIQLWDVETQRQLGVLAEQTRPVVAMVFSPDGKLLASLEGMVMVLVAPPLASPPLPLETGTIRIWDVQNQQPIGLIQLEEIDYFGSIKFSPDGSILAFDTLNGTQLWDVTFQQRIGFFVYGAYSFAFSADGQIFAYAGRNEQTIRLWAVSTQQQVGTLEGHTGIVTSLAFSRDGKWLASGSQDGIILLWEVNLPPGPVAVELKRKQFITLGEVKRTQLLQNYPNPFNPETWIPFVLHEASEVEIRIYSASGHLVRTLQLGRKEPGIYQSKAQAAYWNGKNDVGENVSSGVYFYELHAGDNTFVRKAMLLK